jgi:transcriptional regulator with XRE-family HTH domain
MENLKSKESSKITESNFFGETLKEFRIKKRLTQEEVSKSLNITQAQLSGYENGKSKANLDTIILISMILKVNPLKLIEISLKKTKYFKENPKEKLEKNTTRVSNKRKASLKILS